MYLASVGPDDRRGPAHSLTPLSDPQAQSGRTGSVITPPWHTGSCQLEFRYRMINQANRRPGHAAYPSAIRSKPFAPVFSCRKEQTIQSSRYSTRFYARPPEAVRHKYPNRHERHPALAQRPVQGHHWGIREGLSDPPATHAAGTLSVKLAVCRPLVLRFGAISLHGPEKLRKKWNTPLICGIM